MANNSNIAGARELDAFLQSLPVKTEKNILRASLRAGANVFKKKVKENVPVEHGDLRDSVRVTTRARRGQVTASVKAGNAKAFYWHFVEFGTAAHRIGPKNARALALAGVVVGFVHHPGARPRPYMRPAVDSDADNALQAVGAKIRERLSTVAGIDVPAPETE